jgi:hypothetical protein
MDDNATLHESLSRMVCLLSEFNELWLHEPKPQLAAYEWCDKVAYELRRWEKKMDSKTIPTEGKRLTVNKAKKEQGYIQHPLSRRCRVCQYLVVKEPHPLSPSGDKGLTCCIGVFAVTANAVCDKFRGI